LRDWRNEDYQPLAISRLRLGNFFQTMLQINQSRCTG
jgi:hypothetical protein